MSEIQVKKVTDYVAKFNRNDEETIKQDVCNEQALQWMLEHIPYFECPDKVIEETYYFRWWVFRKHIKQTAEGLIITEFLPNVPWAGPHNSINAAVGHHIAEGRWLRGGEKYLDSYIRFWFKGSGDIYSYSSWIVMAVYEYCLAKGNFTLALDLLHDFVKYYEHIESTNMTRYGLFWSNDDRDAMEMSISGNGLRPTLNSYMYANACAISRVAGYADDSEIFKLYYQKAGLLKGNINKYLWDEETVFYKVIPMGNKDRELAEPFISNIPNDKNAMEVIGYIPWSFGIAEEKNGTAWKYLADRRFFHAEYGPLTAERKHSGTMKPCDTHECLWNGPSWPFATTQTINGMIYALKNHSRNINKDDFMRQMSIYAGSHFRIKENGEKVNWLDENLEGDTGEWLSRRILRDWGWRPDKGGYERGKDYNHSAFCDLVVCGICGVTLYENNMVSINPLLQEGSWDYFLLDNLPVKNHNLTVMYDSTGERYKKGKGLLIFIDGVIAKKTYLTRKVDIMLA
ncbi:MAG: hypothetical protein LBH43_08630 [Treponema sp.]|jgi:hypothetical protein|nr:hypothetical protein [Treponema sp.]